MHPGARARGTGIGSRLAASKQQQGNATAAAVDKGKGSPAAKASGSGYVDWNRAVPGGGGGRRPSTTGGLSTAAAAGRSPYASPPRRVSLAVEQKERILGLEELNNSLAMEASGLEMDKRDLVAQVNQLEQELRAIGDRMESLEKDKQALGAERDEMKGDVAARERLLAAKTQEKRELETDKLALLDLRISLEAQLGDAEEKLKESSKRAEEAEAAVMFAVSEIDGLAHKLVGGAGGGDQAFIFDIAKKIELNGLQSCKGVLRKELKRFSGMVIRAKEEAGEARAMIAQLKREQGRWLGNKEKLERELEGALERSAGLEQQEKQLSSKILSLEARVHELEAELRAAKEERRRVAAIAAATTATATSTATDLDREAIRADIAVLRENSKKAMEQVEALRQQRRGHHDQHSHNHDSRGDCDCDSVAVVKAGAQDKMKALARESMEAMVRAEEQIVALRSEVDALAAALEAARDASLASEREMWEAAERLGSGDGNGGGSPAFTIPAGATYALALVLFAYTMYNSISSE